MGEKNVDVKLSQNSPTQLFSKTRNIKYKNQFKTVFILSERALYSMQKCNILTIE